MNNIPSHPGHKTPAASAAPAAATPEDAARDALQEKILEAQRQKESLEEPHSPPRLSHKPVRRVTDEVITSSTTKTAVLGAAHLAPVKEEAPSSSAALATAGAALAQEPRELESSPSSEARKIFEDKLRELKTVADSLTFNKDPILAAIEKKKRGVAYSDLTKQDQDAIQNLARILSFAKQSEALRATIEEGSPEDEELNALSRDFSGQIPEIQDVPFVLELFSAFFEHPDFFAKPENLFLALNTPPFVQVAGKTNIHLVEFMLWVNRWNTEDTSDTGLKNWLNARYKTQIFSAQPALLLSYLQSGVERGFFAKELPREISQSMYAVIQFAQSGLLTDEAIDYLLEEGIDFSVQEASYGNTALMWAIANAEHKQVLSLITKCPREILLINDRYGKSPLVLLILKGHKITDSEGTPVAHSNTELCQAILNKLDHLTESIDSIEVAMRYAISLRDCEILDLIIEKIGEEQIKKELIAEILANTSFLSAKQLLSSMPPGTYSFISKEQFEENTRRIQEKYGL